MELGLSGDWIHADPAAREPTEVACVDVATNTDKIECKLDAQGSSV